MAYKQRVDDALVGADEILATGSQAMAEESMGARIDADLERLTAGDADPARRDAIRAGLVKLYGGDRS